MFNHKVFKEKTKIITNNNKKKNQIKKLFKIKNCKIQVFPTVLTKNTLKMNKLNWIISKINLFLVTILVILLLKIKILIVTVIVTLVLV